MQAGLIIGSELHRAASIAAAEQLPVKLEPQTAILPQQLSQQHASVPAPAKGASKKENGSKGAATQALAGAAVPTAYFPPPVSAPVVPLTAVDPGACVIGVAGLLNQLGDRLM